MFTYKKIELFTVVHIFSFLHSMTFDLISGLHMQIQTWHPSLRLCIHAKDYVKSGLTNVLKNANKTKNMHLFFDSDCHLFGAIPERILRVSLHSQYIPYVSYLNETFFSVCPLFSRTRHLTIYM